MVARRGHVRLVGNPSRAPCRSCPIVRGTSSASQPRTRPFACACCSEPASLAAPPPRVCRRHARSRALPPRRRGPLVHRHGPCRHLRLSWCNDERAAPSRRAVAATTQVTIPQLGPNLAGNAGVGSRNPATLPSRSLAAVAHGMCGDSGKFLHWQAGTLLPIALVCQITRFQRSTAFRRRLPLSSKRAQQGQSLPRVQAT